MKKRRVCFTKSCFGLCISSFRGVGMLVLQFEDVGQVKKSACIPMHD